MVGDKKFGRNGAFDNTALEEIIAWCDQEEPTYYKKIFTCTETQ